MTHVGAYHVKTHLSELLDRVERGERITITRHGRPVAELAPVSGAADLTPDQAVAELRAFRSRHTLGEGLTVRDLIVEGRR